MSILQIRKKASKTSMFELGLWSYTDSLTPQDDHWMDRAIHRRREGRQRVPADAGGETTGFGKLY